jgi:hypothetical protein
MLRLSLFMLAILISLQNSAQTFVDIQARLTGVSGSACSWIDYDQDGDLDVFVTGEFFRQKNHQISTKLYRNDRHDHFTAVATNIANVYRGAFDWADENQDGIKDLFLIGQNPQGRSIAMLYLGNRSTHFTPVNTGIPGLKDGSVAWGDFDRDGDMDLLLTGQSSSGPIAEIYRNDRHHRFTRIKTNFPGVHFSDGQWADIDQDGDLDVVISGTMASGQLITALFMNNKGVFSKIPLDFSNLSMSDIAWGDYDLDGDLDFAMCGELQNGKYATRLYRNEKNGFFSLVYPNLINVRSGSVDWGDFDHDGDLDLLITGESASGAVSRIFRNDRNGVFTDINAGLLGLYMSDGHFGDYDLDGDLDVIISGLSDQYQFYTKIYRNDSIHRLRTGKSVQQQEEGIFNYSVKVPPKPKKIYYYVFASCYCDLNGNGKKDYHVFMSKVKKPKVQYEMERRFNKIIRQRYPLWPDFDQANIISNGFSTYNKAIKSRNIAIHEYQTKRFHLHEIDW